MNQRIIISFFLLLSLLAPAQNRQDAFADFNFIIHLTKNKYFTEAEQARTALFGRPGLSLLYRDSVNYFLGKEYLKEKQNNKARNLLMQVSDSSFFFYESRYLSALLDAQQNQNDSAIACIVSIGESTNPHLNELSAFELAGMRLLQGRYRHFDSLALSLQFSNPLLQSEWTELQKTALQRKAIKRKSPFVAGTLSAIVPGLGKVYAGNNGQALASFLTCGLLGAVAYENYYHLGTLHPQTLFFSGLFGLFYVGNIWGSALSVQLIKTEKLLENKHNILVSLKIPVDRFFN